MSVRGEPDSGVIVITLTLGEFPDGEAEGKLFVTVKTAGWLLGDAEEPAFPDKVATVDDPKGRGMVTTVGPDPRPLGDPPGVNVGAAV